MQDTFEGKCTKAEREIHIFGKIIKLKLNSQAEKMPSQMDAAPFQILYLKIYTIFLRSFQSIFSAKRVVLDSRVFVQVRLITFQDNQ